MPNHKQGQSREQPAHPCTGSLLICYSLIRHARAAAHWYSDEILHQITTSFDGAEDFNQSMTTLCHKLAKLLDISSKWDSCPISAIFFQDHENEPFRDNAKRLDDGWIAEGVDQPMRLGLAEEEAQKVSERMFILVQGGWTLARALRSPDVLRNLPAFL